MNDKDKNVLNYLKNAPSEVKKLFSSLLVSGAMAMKKVDDEMLKAPILDSNESDGHEIKHREKLSEHVEKFAQGKEDSQYTKKYYAILKRADEIIRESSAEELQEISIKYGMQEIGISKVDKETDENIEDEHGQQPLDKRYNNSYLQNQLEGKNKKVRRQIINESYGIQDGLETEFVFKNEPKLKNDFEVALNPNLKPVYKWPLNVIRKRDVVQKIEQLVELVYIKNLGSGAKRIEFHIPEKYGAGKYGPGTDVHSELCMMDQIRFQNVYGETMAYSVGSYERTRKHNKYDVMVFIGKEIEMI